jgi:4a-hydroxytetrahydrobiopterin dehydratase
MGTASAREALLRLDGWQLAEDEGSITREFGFRSFSEAFAFMTRVAMAAEKLDHHPDWSNSYRTVSVSLSTHDAGGLTELDFKLAARMDRFAAALA